MDAIYKYGCSSLRHYFFLNLYSYFSSFKFSGNIKILMRPSKLNSQNEKFDDNIFYFSVGFLGEMKSV